MVTEGVCGQIKGRWRVLLRKNECDRDMVSLGTLACMILHNICTEQGDSLSRKLDLTFNPYTLQKRNRDEIRDLLKMTPCQKLRYLGKKVRNALCQKVCSEKETGKVLLTLNKNKNEVEGRLLT